jgi:demethylmenaquinone methyltransferase/2-methoxy-6-polyprenyl-1,4-benzoquinol methylase
MRFVVPTFTRLTARSGKSRDREDSRLLWQYYWDTIEQCVPTETVTTALAEAGFEDVAHFQELGMFSEYTGRKPAASPAATMV